MRVLQQKLTILLHIKSAINHSEMSRYGLMKIHLVKSCEVRFNYGAKHPMKRLKGLCRPTHGRFLTQSELSKNSMEKKISLKKTKKGANPLERQFRESDRLASNGQVWPRRNNRRRNRAGQLSPDPANAMRCSTEDGIILEIAFLKEMTDFDLVSSSNLGYCLNRLLCKSTSSCARLKCY